MRRVAVDPLLGRTVGGRYKLIERLGSGGMSSVYLARHTLIDRQMAIKTLRRDLARDPVQRDRFIREARAVNRINHENIVEITDFGETGDGLVYLVMEYVPGESLLSAMRGGPFSGRRAFDIAEQAASALGRAHQMGVIHRDLKPENILLVDRRGRPDFLKILDFGIAKIMDAPSLTGSQQIFGTPGYIAPEYIQSTEIDGRADLYSLGVILYELVTGALPFDYEYPGDLLVKHVTEEPIRPSVRRPSVEPVIEAFVLRCLEKNPARRFRDAFHFIEELRASREQLADPAPRRSSPIDRRTPDAHAPHAEGETPADGLPAPTATSSPETDQGIGGVKRWRERYDAIRTCLDELAARSILSQEVEQAMARAGGLLESLEDATEDAYARQRALEVVSNRARDYRSTLGRTLDELAARLSRAEGARLASMDRRDRVSAERRAALHAKDAARADELLFQIAAVDQELAEHDRQCELLDHDVRELRGQLERENEVLEKEIEVLSKSLDKTMMELWPMAGELRTPLEEAEVFVRANWSS